MPYRYDLHCHTKEGSRCSDISPGEMVELYREMGYAGICVTDHFTGVMNPLPDDAPWGERVDLFHDIYQRVRAEGEKVGLSVYFGIEYALAPDIDRPSITTGTDFLIFNIGREWLKGNQAAFRESPEALFKRIRAAGGFVIHAHPMLGRELRLFPHDVDAAEVINGGVDASCNQNAKTYAGMYGLTQTAGTDIHRFDQVLMAGVETQTPQATIAELTGAIKAGQARPFSMARQVGERWLQRQSAASQERKKK